MGKRNPRGRRGELRIPERGAAFRTLKRHTTPAGATCRFVYHPLIPKTEEARDRHPLASRIASLEKTGACDTTVRDETRRRNP